MEIIKNESVVYPLFFVAGYHTATFQPHNSWLYLQYNINCVVCQMETGKIWEGGDE
jgi:hypothetical protein